MLMNKPPRFLKKMGLLSAILLTGLIQGLLITWVIPNHNFDYPMNEESPQ